MYKGITVTEQVTLQTTQITENVKSRSTLRLLNHNNVGFLIFK